MWTLFWDMHSGGDSKDKWEKIYIEADEPEAVVIFYNRLGHNPNRVSCTCCGEDYSISSKESLEQVSGYHRGCRYAYFKDGIEISRNEGFIVGKGIASGVVAKYIEEPALGGFVGFQKLEDYKENKDVYVIYASEIDDEERVGEVPEQGYVWK